MTLLMPGFEQQLREVVRKHQAAHAPVDSRANGDHRPVRRRFHRLVGSPAVAVSFLVVIAVAAVFLMEGHRQPTPVPSSADRPARGLVDILGVLRRPQTPADRSLPLQSFLRSPWSGPVDRPLVRLATVTPWGRKLYLVAFKPGPIRPIPRTLKPNDPAAIALRAQMGKETLAVVTPWSCGSGCAASVGGAAAAEIESQGLLWMQPAGRNFAGGSTAVRLVAVVPDEVAKVVFVLPRQPSISSNPGGPIYRHALRVPVAVQHNVAAIQINRECCDSRPPMIWYAANGHAIRTIGNLAGAEQVIPTIQPATETPLSRAAERNPAIANRVWVTPRTGTVHTNFQVRWRLLLTDADYDFTISGPSGPRCYNASALGGIGGGANDVRGQIYGESLNGASGGEAWCPGTYRISVAVGDLGRAGSLRHRPAPFGTATFTVRR